MADGPLRLRPPRAKGLLSGAVLLTLLLGLTGLGVIQLTAGRLSAWLALWAALPLVCVPLSGMVLYSLWSLLTARYELDRNAFRLRWGLAEERIPLAMIREVRPASEVPSLPTPRHITLPCVRLGRITRDDLQFSWYATRGLEGQLAILADQDILIISPADPEAFLDGYQRALRLGSIESLPRRSLLPTPTFEAILGEPWAMGMILLGALLPLALLGFLGFRIPGLSETVPFGFDPAGAPVTPSPPTRLLLIPLIAEFCWLADLALGWWLYRREGTRALAYAVWAASILVSGLFWGAAWQLLAAA